MSRVLPAHPNLEHLKKQAKDLLHRFEQGDPAATEQLKPAISPTSGTSPKLADAQHAVAREYGFPSWAKLKEHMESLTVPFDPVEALVAAVNMSDDLRVGELLHQHPELKSKLNDPLPGFAFGGTALLQAVRAANRKLVDILLEAGADINQRSHWWAGGFGVLDDDRGLAPYLIKRGAILDAHAAARLGMMDDLKKLVSVHPELVHARGGDGQTPLHFASTVEIAEYLLDNGADIDARDIDHESTPAQYMVRKRQEVARYLVSRGCWTDILMAAALGDLELVRRHLDADPGCVHKSVSAHYFPKKDPRSGGTIYIWYLGSNKTAHTVAREFRHERIFQLLMERSPASLKLSIACELGDEAAFQSLLGSNPALAQSLSNDERSKIVAAAEGNNTQAVRMMLAAGWPVDARGGMGETALHFAAWHGNTEMMKEVLKHRPPLEGTDMRYGDTPLGWALVGSKHSWERHKGNYGATVEMLLQAGAKPPELAKTLQASEAVQLALRRVSGA
ncbi:MAG TPA: ankyrin repeat domain-containing protein [Candidatus Angelobacter sp.]|nr:ankyrin repeat domain-containing protein [Candidatus Angelobacter sp.]